MKKIMILGASILQLPAIRKAKEMGLSVVAVDMNPNAIGFREIGIEKEIISTIDIPAVTEAAQRHHIDGVMTLASDMPMRTVAAVAEKMHLIGVNMDTAVKATDKAEMRKALQEYGVPIPAFFKVSSEEEYLKAADCFRVPFMVKPADNSGSRGISRLTPEDSREASLEAYRYSRSYSRNGDVVVEEFMEGQEISVETLSTEGTCHVIQITDKITTGAPHFVEMGHTQPTRCTADMVERIKKVAADANRAVGILNGPSHTEIMVTAEGPKIVELGARLGGDCITTHLVPLSTGVDMVECCIRIALGEAPNLKPKFKKASAIRYFQQYAGKVKEITGIEEANKVPGIKQISVVHGIGEQVSEIESSADRLGFVIAQGGSADEAADACWKAMDKIRIEIE